MDGNLRAMCSLLGAEPPTIPFFRNGARLVRRRGDFLMGRKKGKKKEKGRREKKKGDERGERKGRRGRKNWNSMNRENSIYILYIYTIYYIIYYILCTIYIYLFIQLGIRGLISLSSSIPPKSPPLQASSSTILLFHTGKLITLGAVR